MNKYKRYPPEIGEVLCALSLSIRLTIAQIGLR